VGQVRLKGTESSHESGVQTQAQRGASDDIWQVLGRTARAQNESKGRSPGGGRGWSNNHLQDGQVSLASVHLNYKDGLLVSCSRGAQDTSCTGQPPDTPSCPASSPTQWMALAQSTIPTFCLLGHVCAEIKEFWSFRTRRKKSLSKSYSARYEPTLTNKGFQNFLCPLNKTTPAN